jgi:hypothetical protein
MLPALYEAGSDISFVLSRLIDKLPRLRPSSLDSAVVWSSPSVAMSHAPLSAALPPNFESTFNSALDAYKKRTKQDLTSHPLLPNLQACHSPNDVLAVFREQIPMLDDSSHDGDEKFTTCLVPTVNVIYRFWATLGEEAGMVNFGILPLIGPLL